MNEIEDVVREIHAAPQQAVVVASGAGSRAVAWLLGVAGASRTILEVLVPYGRLSMVGFLGYEPGQFVSEATARDMAKAAYQRGMRLREGRPPLVGLACTATIATDRPKLGAHRCYVATWEDAKSTCYSLALAKGRRDRNGEEEVVSRLMLRALAEGCGLETTLDLGLTGEERVETHTLEHPDPITLLLSGEAAWVTVYADGRMAVDEPLGKSGVLPGSFSPLHRGHERLAETAGHILGTAVVFELSVANVDKPPLARAEVRQRLAQLAGKGTVVLTRAETFRKKAGLFPGCTFIIGWDTAVRLVAPRYYGGDESAMLTALAEIWAAGCRFLVAGREDQGTFRTLSDVTVPQGFSPLFQSIPESLFRADVSSSALRAQARGRAGRREAAAPAVGAPRRPSKRGP
jgi:nicotinic acid mononucleotide adenylyltransferase